ncbi:MAG TPA: adenosylcobinamide-GDP ribazoletransferase [Methylomirabilota bacterium]|nr:adenosylcobinamide-GDP ribazoletransferase [Methylomirabilota bacterium]
MSALVAAFRHLTIVPFGGPAHVGPRALGHAAPWFPVVGAALGLALALVATVTDRVFPPLLAALLTVTAWKLLTGGLHLDGLADCLDGLVGRDPEHRLAIMGDSRIGAFGAVGLILFLMLELVAVAELPPPARWRALIAAPAIARATPVLLARLFRPARAEGQGAAFHAGLGRGAAPAALAVALVVAVAALGGVGVVAVGVAALAVTALGAFLARRLGGITGDVLGAGVEVGELAVLLTVSAWAHARL